uniref:Outer mitochondrial transmembrane helix translocase n=2 Tax=Cercopithecinae TaxID=9528 RepID=A0A2K5XH45_MANLE
SLRASGSGLPPEAFSPRLHFLPVRGRLRAFAPAVSAPGLTIKMVHAEAFSRPLSRNEVVGLIFRLTIFGAVTYFTIKWMVDAIDPTRKQKVEAQKQAEKLMKQIGVKNVKLSEYEMSIAAHLVDPLNMHVTWSDIAGLDDVITDLKDTVILPIKKKHLFENSRLLQPPKGVLLYGPPGCGKTLIAKATAKEAGCRFINLQPSTLTDKWYGESQKLAAAVFSLAIKLQPSIIFIDEIDSFLRNRSSSDHEATAMMKAQFMSLWDGLDTDHSCQVIVMGATNRPQDLDSAIMRRMPTRFHINQPALKQREAILKLILKNENVDRHVDLLEVAQETDGFSGSDLKEMCRDAALLCVREYVNSTSEESHDEDEIRPVQQQDLHRAIEKMKKSKDAAFQNVLTHVCLD